MNALLLVGLLAAYQPTYAKDVASVLQDSCQVCHHPGTAAPFSLLTYEDAVKHADDIREAVAAGRMPPWFADPRYGKFANDRRLRPADKDRLIAWTESGTARGDDKDLPPPRAWESGWMIGKPDLVLDMPAAREVPASGTLDYQRFQSKVPWTESRWVTAVEIQPGNRSVVHHAQLFLGTQFMVASFAPGSQPMSLPADTAVQFPAGGTLTWLMHYTPNGKATTDRSRVGFRFWRGDKPPKYARVILDLQNFEIDIPPGSRDTVAEYGWTAPGDTQLISVLPHMHLRGKDFRLDLTYPDGRTETALAVPRYDFNWQFFYDFAEPLDIPKGTSFRFTSHYDNSADNPANPDPKKHVKWGEQTEDEMQTVLLDFRVDNDPAKAVNLYVSGPTPLAARRTGAPVAFYAVGAGAVAALAAVLLALRRGRLRPQASA